MSSQFGSTRASGCMLRRLTVQMVGARAKCGSAEVLVELVLDGVLLGVDEGGAAPPSGLKNHEATEAHCKATISL